MLVRQGAGVGLRRRARASRRTSPAGRDRGWDRVVLDRARADLAAEVLTYGPSRGRRGAAELRDDVLARLQGILERAEAVR